MQETMVDDDDDRNLMMVAKPDWVDHEQTAINAVSIHPEGARMATAGGDSRVKIWAVAPLLQEPAEHDDRIEKLLCTLTVHTGGVNSVRWSPSGHLLASGGDDRAVLLWMYAGKASGGNSFSGPAVESYKCVGNLVGHEADIQDLAWSPDCRRLASCSVDNSIIIWNTDTFTRIATLTGHTNWVKGLAWDPLDGYLISQSEDGTMVVWRTEDWVAEHTIRKPFLDKQFAHNYASDINRQIVFRRPSWSPDGSVVVGSYAHHKVFTSPVLNRGSWKKNVAFVGHTRPTTVSRFNPRLFTRDGPSKEGGGKFYVCAVGSMDSSISIWATHSKTPLAVFRHFFAQAVLDMSWTPDGLSLLICSHEGEIAAIRFGLNDFGGRRMTDAEQRAAIDEQSVRVVAPIAETPTALQLRAGAPFGEGASWPQPPERSRLDRLDRLMSGRQSSAIGASSQPGPDLLKTQQESRAPDGKRRIVPVLASGPSGPAAPPAPGPSQSVQRPAALPAVELPAEHSMQPQPWAKPVSIAALERRQRFAVPVDTSMSDETQKILGLQPLTPEPIVVEVITGASGTSQLRASKGSTPVWRAILHGTVVDFRANSSVCVAVTSDGDMFWLSPTGMRTHPPVILPAQPSHLSLNSSCRVLTICSDASLALWDAVAGRVLLEASIAPLLRPGLQFSTAVIDPKSGYPVVTLSNSYTFTYSADLRAWLRIADDSFVQSELYSSLSGGTSGGSLAPLAYMSVDDRALITLAHAEHQLATADVTGSSEEYRFWALTLCRCLVKRASAAHPHYQTRLGEFCFRLLGPLPTAGSAPPPWQSHAAAGRVSKRDLLRQFIPVIAENPSLQKLAVLLAQQLDRLSSNDTADRRAQA
ncbi:unnamed protein product (mitochondrion) [Plasmodiophora brassicae]|uniref:Protein HIRA n=1 Tax=Plasmodiophora brassicae TaxID=37360 RepID=A0A3P3YIT3_PLABS|nr:unnamed protein product [Plasmodiophora brassicae]